MSFSIVPRIAILPVLIVAWLASSVAGADKDDADKLRIEIWRLSHPTLNAEEVVASVKKLRFRGHSSVLDGGSLFVGFSDENGEPFVVVFPHPTVVPREVRERREQLVVVARSHQFREYAFVPADTPAAKQLYELVREAGAAIGVKEDTFKSDERKGDGLFGKIEDDERSCYAMFMHRLKTRKLPDKGPINDLSELDDFIHEVADIVERERRQEEEKKEKQSLGEKPR